MKPIYFILLFILGVFLAHWPNSVDNPANSEDVTKTACTLGISPKDVTQKQFNERY